MFWIFNLAALLCMVYYIVILVYSGISTSWSFLWLIAAAMFLFLAFGTEYYIKHAKKIPLWVPVSVVTTLLAGITVFGVIEVLIFTNAAGRDAQGMDYVIVLGTEVRGEKISDSLKKRLDKVLVYAEQNPDTIFILSGGKGRGEALSEADAMFAYLSYNGLPEDKMIKEGKSTNTKENIEYSKNVIRTVESLRKHSDDGEMKIAVLSSDFHVFRAKQIAKKMGITDIYGIQAETNQVLFIHLCVREALAVFKDKLLGNM
ncbi:MAG: YdcF family protein [bacterium]|nr:YdcF family protein [bacterium]